MIFCWICLNFCSFIVIFCFVWSLFLLMNLVLICELCFLWWILGKFLSCFELNWGSCSGRCWLVEIDVFFGGGRLVDWVVFIDIEFCFLIKLCGLGFVGFFFFRVVLFCWREGVNCKFWDCLNLDGIFIFRLDLNVFFVLVFWLIVELMDFVDLLSKGVDWDLWKLEGFFVLDVWWMGGEFMFNLGIDFWWCFLSFFFNRI